MPESEVFKLVMNGGLFGLWVLFLLWLFNRGIPMAKTHVETVIASNQASLEKLSTANQNALEKLANDFKQHTQELNANHKDQVKVLADTHREAVGTLDKTHRQVVENLARECREERKEIMSVLYAHIGAKHEPKAEAKIIVPAGQTQ